MEDTVRHVVLADDDADDCMFFEEALKDLSASVILKTINNGVKLMQFLQSKPAEKVDIIFLDLNMPLKNGLECLSEIKESDKLRHLPIIIFSTSFNMKIVDLAYEKGASYYIRKPGEFDKLKKVIFNALTCTLQSKSPQPVRDKFILEP